MTSVYGKGIKVYGRPYFRSWSEVKSTDEQMSQTRTCDEQTQHETLRVK